MEPTEVVLLYAYGEKKLSWVRNGGAEQRDFTASASKIGIGSKQDSLCTPPGLHRVEEKYGDEAPAGTVFVGRRSQEICYGERSDAGPQQKALVTTRILRLAGLEAGKNRGPGVDSYERYIYIHGNNHPERFPENMSSGCVILRDDDLIWLFEHTPRGSHVWIEG